MGAVFLILLLAPALIHAQLRSSQLCKGASGARGSCVSLRQCQPLWDLYLSRNPTKTDVLRRSHCGFEGRSPLVCCVANNQDARLTSTKPVPTAGGRSVVTPNKPKKTTAQPSRVTPAAMTVHPGSKLLPRDCGHEVVDLIVGGTKAQLREHPWLVALEFLTAKGPFVGCGGTLITLRYVLTAAHCIRSNSNERLQMVLVGEHDMSTPVDCENVKSGKVCAPAVQRIGIERTIIHPQYSSGGDRHNDIAIIRLRNSAVGSEYVRPVCLPSGDSSQARAAAGRQQTVAGWGRTGDSWKSDVKLKVVLPIMENSKCAELYAGKGVNLADTQVCAGGQKGKDSCVGDSGGPLLDPQIRDGEPEWAISGIVSIGPKECGTLNQPGIYTRVAPYIPWILDNLQP